MLTTDLRALVVAHQTAGECTTCDGRWHKIMSVVSRVWVVMVDAGEGSYVWGVFSSREAADGAMARWPQTCFAVESMTVDEHV